MMHDVDLKNSVKRCWDQSSTTYDSSGHQIVTPEEREAWKQELRVNLPPPLFVSWMSAAVLVL
ncbi:MAG TPA: hypothetical protein VN372_02815 [Methanospirillum sp.]|nr:hypothetical protein [Methanospirillum sp.]